jgi:hypothetical protein
VSSIIELIQNALVLLVAEVKLEWTSGGALGSSLERYL